METLKNKELTNIDKEVLELLSQGKDYKGIAEVRGVTPSTARNQIDRLKKKLEASNIAHAVAIGYERGILNVSVE